MDRTTFKLRNSSVIKNIENVTLPPKTTTNPLFIDSLDSIYEISIQEQSSLDSKISNISSKLEKLAIAKVLPLALEKDSTENSNVPIKGFKIFANPFIESYYPVLNTSMSEEIYSEVTPVISSAENSLHGFKKNEKKYSIPKVIMDEKKFVESPPNLGSILGLREKSFAEAKASDCESHDSNFIKNSNHDLYLENIEKNKTLEQRILEAYTSKLGKDLLPPWNDILKTNLMEKEHLHVHHHEHHHHYYIDSSVLKDEGSDSSKGSKLHPTFEYSSEKAWPKESSFLPADNDFIETASYTKQQSTFPFKTVYQPNSLPEDSSASKNIPKEESSKFFLKTDKYFNQNMETNEIEMGMNKKKSSSFDSLIPDKKLGFVSSHYSDSNLSVYDSENTNFTSDTVISFPKAIKLFKKKESEVKNTDTRSNNYFKFMESVRKLREAKEEVKVPKTSKNPKNRRQKSGNFQTCVSPNGVKVDSTSSSTVKTRADKKKASASAEESSDYKKTRTKSKDKGIQVKTQSSKIKNDNNKSRRSKSKSKSKIHLPEKNVDVILPPSSATGNITGMSHLTAKKGEDKSKMDEVSQKIWKNPLRCELEEIKKDLRQIEERYLKKKKKPLREMKDKNSFDGGKEIDPGISVFSSKTYIVGAENLCVSKEWKQVGLKNKNVESLFRSKNFSSVEKEMCYMYSSPSLYNKKKMNHQKEFNLMEEKDRSILINAT